MKYFCTFICLIASVNVQQIVADDQCIQKSPCRCKFGNGTGYDLSMLAKTLDGLDQNYIITPSIGTIKFFFHPCTDITNPIDSGNYSVAYENQTIYSPTNISNTHIILGLAADAKFKVQSDSDVNLIYVLKNTTTIIKLACTNIAENNLYAPPLNTIIGDFSMILYSRHACLKEMPNDDDDDTGMSVGALLLVTFLVIFFGYLFIGVTLKYFVVGARGTEVVPNINFWRNLPSLLKDGVTFLQNGCKRTPEMSQNHDSYISI